MKKVTVECFGEGCKKKATKIVDTDEHSVVLFCDDHYTEHFLCACYDGKPISSRDFTGETI